MPNIQPLFGTLHLHFSTFFFHKQVQIQIWWCSTRVLWIWIPFNMMQMKNLYSIFLQWNLSILIYTKLNAQNNLSLGTCQVGDILVVVHSFLCLNVARQFCFWLDHLLGRRDFGIVGYVKMAPNGKTKYIYIICHKIKYLCIISCSYMTFLVIFCFNNHYGFIQ
jgi:hypothetical protein